MAIVVDASVSATWFLGDETSSFGKKILNRVADEGAYVPAIFRWEIANLLLTAERADRISADDVDAAIDALRDLPITLEEPGSRVFAGADIRFARFYNLTAYDAAYLSIATNGGLALATLDDPLARAARDLGITVLR